MADGVRLAFRVGRTTDPRNWSVTPASKIEFEHPLAVLRMQISEPKKRADVEDNFCKTIGQLFGCAAVLSRYSLIGLGNLLDHHDSGFPIDDEFDFFLQSVA